MSSLIKILTKLTVMPFKLLLVWLYSLHIFYLLFNLNGTQFRNELKLIKGYNLVYSYRFFDLILSPETKEMIGKDVR